MIFGLNCINARQTSGASVIGLPKWSSTLATVYKPNDKLSFVGRFNYRRHADLRVGANPLDVGSIGTFDLGANYTTKVAGHEMKFSLMCTNLFNRDYWYASGSSLGHGMPRAISLSASMKF